MIWKRKFKLQNERENLFRFFKTLLRNIKKTSSFNLHLSKLRVCLPHRTSYRFNFYA